MPLFNYKVTEKATCPHCKHKMQVEFTDDNSGPKMVYCEPDDDGCGEYFAVDFEIWHEVKVYVFSLTLENGEKK